MAQKVNFKDCPFTITIDHIYINVKWGRTTISFILVSEDKARYHSHKHGTPRVSAKIFRQMQTWANQATFRMVPKVVAPRQTSPTRQMELAFMNN